MLDPQLAEKIIKEVRQLIDESVIIVDRSGTIIAGTEENRVGRRHGGALLVTKQKKTLVVTEEIAGRWPDVRPGVNLPIFFRDQVVGVIGITGDPRKVSGYGQLLQKMTELIIRESYYQKQLDIHERTLEGFVFDWLNDRDWDDTFLSYAELLQIDLHCDRQALLIRFADPISHLSSETVRALPALFHCREEDILVRWGNDHILLLADATHPKRIDEAAANHWVQTLYTHFGKLPLIGIGSVQSASRADISFRQARRALHAAGMRKPVIFERQLMLEMIVDELSRTTKRLFLARALGPLIQNEELLNTLKMLVAADFSLKRTSEDMHIHINTLHYRLKKVERLTGLNPRKLRSRVIFYLAIAFMDE